MRIALIDPSLTTWPYDTELALALRRAGHDVTVFGSSIDEGDDARADDLLRRHFYKSLDQFRLKKSPRKIFLAIKGLSHIASMFSLLSALRDLKPDIIHFQWAPLPVVDRWYLPVLRRIAPLILTVHDSVPFHNDSHPFLQSWGAIGIVSQFDHLIVHTMAAKKRVESYGVDARCISVMPHGPLGGNLVNLDTVGRAPSPRAKSRKVIVLLFGRIKPYKGLDVLLRAVAQIPKEIATHLEVRVVGEPHMNMEFAKSFVARLDLGDVIKFDLRFVGDDEIGDILAAADIMVMPYREIDASGVLMMALSAGLPVVASRIGLFAEILRDGEHGRLVEVEDDKGLACALSELVTNSVLLQHMRKQVFALVDSLPDWAEIARRTERVYAKEVAAAAGP